MTGHMQCIRVAAFGGPERLTLVDEQLPEPALGEVRIRTVCAGVSYPDLLIREGTYPGGPKPPFIPGYDVVGVVDKLGPGVTEFRPGDTVAAITVFGGYAEAVCVPEAHLAPVPSDVDPAEAVTLAFNYITAYQMLTRVAHVRPGTRILVHGGAGGIGSAALEIGRTARLEMFGTATSAGLHIVTDLGATAIDYRTEDFVARIRELTHGGVDVVLDGIGGMVALRSYRVLAPHGLLIMYGHYSTLVDGRRSLARTALFYALGALTLAANGIPGGRRVRMYRSAITRDRHPDWYRTDVKALFQLHAQGHLHPLIAARLPLTAAREAHERLARGGVPGRIVLTNG